MKRRDDILNNLPHGAQKHIARRLGCGKTYVNKILSGTKPQDSQMARRIIDLAQLMAAVHIWNNRFNKHEINLNPLEL